ncbi:MAG TPA: hypothetical protein VHJ38_17150, partial [Nitrososphaeraceae archaeon]|nr:hypothetical protein [Nitrososphaeraceae archaeon]
RHIGITLAILIQKSISFSTTSEAYLYQIFCILGTILSWVNCKSEDLFSNRFIIIRISLKV